MHINLEKVSVKFNLNENIINKIIEINDCSNNNDKRVFNQILKNQEVELFNNVRIANGANKTNTLTIIYLSAYENSKLNNETEIKLFNNPSKENKLNVFSSIEITEFIFWIKLENEIFWLKIFLPISLIDEEIIELISIIFPQIKYEQLIAIPIINNLKINWYGLSICIETKFEYNNLKQ